MNKLKLELYRREFVFQVSKNCCTFCLNYLQVGGHDRLGMQLVPLKLLTPHETKDFTLDLLKHTNISDPKDMKQRGKIVVELTYVPFKEDSIKFSSVSKKYSRKGSGNDQSSDEEALSGAGLLSVLVQGAEDVEGENHNNPYAIILFKGDKKRTKVSFLSLLYAYSLQL